MEDMITKKQHQVTSPDALRDAASTSTSGDFTAYYSFSKKGKELLSSNTEDVGLSGFLEYRKLDGSWRPFLFQTIDFQLVVFRVHMAYQIQVMSTDIRNSTEIALAYEGETKQADTRLIRLGINGTVIILRAVSHHAALYWVEGLRQLKEGKRLEIETDRITMESEEDIFREIDQLTCLREWKPPPPTNTPFCVDLCLRVPSRPLYETKPEKNGFECCIIC